MGGCQYELMSNRPLEGAEDLLAGVSYTIDSSREWWSTARKARVVIDWFRPVTANMLRDKGCVELIIARSAGYDYIDIRATREAGVCVANQPELIDEAVAEHAVAGILAALRRLLEAASYTPRWHSEGWPRHLAGSLLMGRTIGFLGMGRIAHSILYKLLPYHPEEVLYYSRTPKPGLESMPIARRASLEELFERSMILVNTLPLTEETRGIVTADLLLRLPRGAVYVNVGRGGTEAENAVVEAWRRRPDLYFVLDVHPAEPIPPDSPRMQLYGKPRVVMTPHLAGYSLESRIGTTILAVKQALDYLRRGCVWNPVAGPCKPCWSGTPSLLWALREARRHL